MNIEEWSTIVGFLMPALVSVINQVHWLSWQKALVALLASVVGGTVTALLNHNFTGASWVTAIAIVFGSSQLFYHTWFKNSGISAAIEKKVNLPIGGRSSASAPSA